MKLKKGTLLFLLLTCLVYTNLAQTEYKLDGNDVDIDENGMITACRYNFGANTEGTQLIIPKSVTKNSKTITIKGIYSTFLGVFQRKNLVSVKFAGDSEVTTIAYKAFEGNNITALILPTGVTTIGISAFASNEITELTFPENSQLTTIERFAFYDNKITALFLPEGLTTIGSYAFANNEITELTFPDDSQLTAIGAETFTSNPLLSFTLPSVTKKGFRTYWKDGISADLVANLTIPKADFGKSFELGYIEQFTLTVKVNNEEGGSIEPSDDHFAIDKADAPSTQELTATPNDGWRFDKWVITGGGDNNDNPITVTVVDVDVTVDADKTATAHFVQLVTLTTAVAEQQGGTIAPLIDPNGKVYDINTKVELTATPNDGWRFDKWVITGGGDNNDNPITVTVVDVDVTVDADKTATAHFVQLVTLTTAVAEQQGGTISANPNPYLDNQYDINTKVELTATPDEGWRFDKWEISDEENKTDKTTTITLDQDKTATAHFVEEEEAITSILTEVVSATPYPNPVTSQITLKAKDGDLIQLFSPKGKQQYSTQHTGNEVHTIDVSTLPVGVYLVRITDAEGNTTTKRIVKK